MAPIHSEFTWHPVSQQQLLLIHHNPRTYEGYIIKRGYNNSKYPALRPCRPNLSALFFVLGKIHTRKKSPLSFPDLRSGSLPLLLSDLFCDVLLQRFASVRERVGGFFFREASVQPKKYFIYKIAKTNLEKCKETKFTTKFGMLIGRNIHQSDTTYDKERTGGREGFRFCATSSNKLCSAFISCTSISA